jgi:hypothetical protein
MQVCGILPFCPYFLRGQHNVSLCACIRVCVGGGGRVAACVAYDPQTGGAMTPLRRHLLWVDDGTDSFGKSFAVGEHRLIHISFYIDAACLGLFGLKPVHTVTEFMVSV